MAILRVKSNFIFLTSDASWFFSGSNPRSLNTSIVCRDYSSPKHMETNVARVTLFCRYAEIAYSKPSGYELSAFTCWQVFVGQPIKTVIWRVYLNQFAKISNEGHICILYQKVCFYYNGFNLSWWNPLRLSKILRHCPFCTPQEEFWGICRTEIRAMLKIQADWGGSSAIGHMLTSLEGRAREEQSPDRIFKSYFLN